MITTKQRANLRSLCNRLEPVLQIGKEGVNEGTIKHAQELFEARELFKINKLKTCEDSAKDVALKIQEKTNCEIVQCIGNKICLYKRSTKKDINHIEF